jgi:hypothetical protein
MLHPRPTDRINTICSVSSCGRLNGPWYNKPTFWKLLFFDTSYWNWRLHGPRKLPYFATKRSLSPNCIHTSLSVIVYWLEWKVLTRYVGVSVMGPKRLLSGIISFVLVPMYLHYLSPTSHYENKRISPLFIASLCYLELCKATRPVREGTLCAWLISHLDWISQLPPNCRSGQHNSRCHALTEHWVHFRKHKGSVTARYLHEATEILWVKYAELTDSFARAISV